MLTSMQFNTPLGDVLALADEQSLFLLEYVDYKLLRREIQQIEKFMKSEAIQGDSVILSSIKRELKAYLSGNLREFKTPISPIGTSFQKLTWSALTQIPYGTTISYAELASKVGKPSAFRAVANANGANKLCIFIPCHRVINSGGGLGGYAGGVERKKWLLAHEGIC